MAAVAQCILLILFFTVSITEGRFLRLNSSNDHLISDGVDPAENQGPPDGANSCPSTPNTCNHQYGFLPCAENAAGYIFLIFVYHVLLEFGNKQIGVGSKVLFNYFGVAGKFGGVIFRILMSLPSMILMIVSGVFGSPGNAQSLVSLGVGIYAGMTVFSLTLKWGICVIFGKTNLKSKPDKHAEASHSDSCFPGKEKLTILKDTGVSIDQRTRTTGGIMLLSLIPFIIVQFVNIFNTSSGDRATILIALISSCLSLISYFIYQIWDPEVQKRSLDYSEYEVLQEGFLRHVQRHGQLVNEGGELNTHAIKKLFAEIDKNADNYITKRELKDYLPRILQNSEEEVDQRLFMEAMKCFDSNGDNGISEEEFIERCGKWIEEINQSSENKESTSTDIAHDELVHLFKEEKEYDPQEMDRIMAKILKHVETQVLKEKSLITRDGKPNIDEIRKLFKRFDSDKRNSISRSQVEQLIRTVNFGKLKLNCKDIVTELFKEFDKDSSSAIDQAEFVMGVANWVTKAIRAADTPHKTRGIHEFHEMVWKEGVLHSKWALITSLIRILLGIFMLTFLGGPLTVSILQGSYAMYLPSFIVSIFVVPLVMNARAGITALLPAREKTQRTASLTFSEIYSEVIMNNLAGLTTLLAIVYAKDLAWDFSAEVLIILFVCAIIGMLAHTCSTYPLWTCVLAFFLYVFSLSLYYFVNVFLSWN